MKKALVATLLLCGYAAGQQINPNTQLNWSVASGCGTLGAAYSPASGSCISVSSPTTGWDGTLAANQGTSDTTATVTLNTGTIALTGGTFRVDSEWEIFASATLVSGTTYTLNMVTRGEYNTSSASHASGASVVVAILPLANSTQAMAAFAGGNPGDYFFAINCPTATNQSGTLAFMVGCGIADSFYVNKSDGHFTAASSSPNYIWGSGGLSIDTNSLESAYNDLLNNAYALKATAQIMQTVLPTQMDKAIGFGSGISGVNSVVAPTAAAPIIQDGFVPPGSTTNTYLCQGTDYLGDNIPGTSASIANLAASGWGVGVLNIYCPLIPGAVTSTLCRTAGGPNQGIIKTVTSGQLTFQDQYTSASGACPANTNTTLGAVCTSGNQYCLLSGTSSTPPQACGSPQEGWEYHDTAASPSFSYYRCESGTWTGIATGTNGIQSINGDTTPAQTLTCSGSGLTCPTSAGNTLFTLAGGGLTGSIISAGGLNEVVYPAGAAGTTVGAASASLTEPLNRTTAQLNTDFSTANIRIHLQNGDAHTPFSNSSHHNPVVDDRGDVPAFLWNVKASGAQCDAGTSSGTFTAGSQTITGKTCSSSNVGEVVMANATVAGVPTSLISTVASINGSNQCVMTSQAPFTTSSGWTFTIGHDDSAALADALSYGYNSNVTVALPVGSCFSSKTLNFDGQNIWGQGVGRSIILGPTGLDTFAATDPSVSTVQFRANQHIKDFTIEANAEIDATNPWTQCVDAVSGSTPVCTAQTPLYRPLSVGGMLANFPLNYQWITGTGVYSTGAINGVANTTSSSAVVCVPTTETLPTPGQQILFPYQGLGNAPFSTTVASTSGSCSTGFSPVTLANSWPGSTLTGPQYVAAQEWFAGTSIQNTATAIPATGRTFPMQVNLANSIVPDPQFSQAGFASFGLIEFADTGEICSYYGTSNIPASQSLTQNWVNLTACAQNGTTAAAHATGTQIFPLNPVNPSLPWPVANLNTHTTPTGAEYYPAMGGGNAAIAIPVVDGSHYTGEESPALALWENVALLQYPVSTPTAQSPNSFQVQNDTMGLYIVPTPFKSTFKHLTVSNFFYGIAEGDPSTNTYGEFSGGFPTADGNKWDDIQVQSAAYDEIINGEGSSEWKAIQNFSQSFVAPNNNWPGLTNAGGGQGDLILDGHYDDQSGSCCNNEIGIGDTHFDGHYVEVEAPTVTNELWGKVPARQLNCNECIWTNWIPKDGGDPAPTYIGGRQQQFIGGSATGNPWLNFGSNNVFLNMTGLTAGARSNVYGSSGFLNWGPGTQTTGSASFSAPFLSNAAGNSRQLCTGQTQSMFANGNVAVPYTCEGDGFITPDEFNTSHAEEPSPMTQGWTLDPTEPVTGAYASCNVTSGGGCEPYQWDNEADILIGPQQRIVPGQYLVYTSFKAPTTSGTATFHFFVDARSAGSCSGGNIANLTITPTTSWAVYGPYLVDFTGKSGCDLTLFYLTSSVSSLPIETGFADFVPLAQNITAKQFTTTGTGTAATIFSGAGVPTGCGTTYSNGSLYLNTSGTTGSMLYTCIGTTWTDIK